MKESDLLVIDYNFPYVAESFRDEEYLYYLRCLNAHFLNAGRAINWPMFEKLNNSTQGLFAKNFKQNFEGKYKLAYSIGLNNTYTYFNKFYKQLSLPFVFTLYPGFGFSPFEKEQPHLRALIESPLCRAVIVTQPTTLNCLKQHGLNNKTTYVNGAPIASSYLASPARKEPKNPKKTKICFIAHKYVNEDRKGFTEFTQAAQILHGRFPDDFEWHVVGAWPKEHGFINYHGIQSKDYLKGLYTKIDAVVAPVKFLGNELDGFPTASSIEAGATGCALLITDTHNQNECFAEGEWLRIEADPQMIADTILKNKHLFPEIGLRGQHKIKAFYSFENQVLPRFELIKSFL